MAPDLSSFQTRHKHCGALDLHHRAADKPVPTVTFDGAVFEGTGHPRYLGIHFDRMMTHRKHVETTALKCKKGLSVLKAVAAKCIEQRQVFLLYQSVVLSVIDYGLGLTTVAQTNPLKVDRVQNEAMRVILGTTKDTPIETTRFLLDLTPVQARQKVERVKAYFSAVENPRNPLHEAVKDTEGCRLGRHKSWMGQAEDSIQRACQLTELKQTKEWEWYPNRFRRLC